MFLEMLLEIQYLFDVWAWNIKRAYLPFFEY